MKIVFHKNFQKKYIKLPPAIKQKFKDKKDLFLSNPLNPILDNHSVDKAYPGCRSINITGDYRAIFRQNNYLTEFINIGTHSQLYG